MSARLIRDRVERSRSAVIAWARVTSPVVAFLVATAGLLMTVPGGSVRGIELTTDAAPLAVAGRSALAVVGYVNLGQRHLYVPVESLLLVAIAAALAARGGVATLLSIGLGAAAAVTLVVVTGCPCGSGAATSLWQLAG